MNKIFVIGNVVRDAELKEVDVNGVKTPRCRFSVAVNETKSNGENIVNYFEVTVWREYGASIAPWVKQGRQVHVWGTFRLNQYTKDGVVKTALQIANPQVTLLGKKPEAEIIEDVEELPFE